MPTEKPTEAQAARLANVLGWARTAKENLPAINDGRVAADRIAQMSALLDRLYESAMRMRVQLAAEPAGRDATLDRGDVADSRSRRRAA